MVCSRKSKTMGATYVLSSFAYYHTAWQEQKGQYTQMEALLDTIPEEASVACGSFLLAHIADRDEIYELEYHGCVDDVDYVVLDTRYGDQEQWLHEYEELGYTVEMQEEGLMTILMKEE